MLITIASLLSCKCDLLRVAALYPIQSLLSVGGTARATGGLKTRKDSSDPH